MPIFLIKNIQEVEILIQSFMIYLKFWNSKMLNHLKDQKCDSKQVDIISLKLILNFDSMDNFEWMFNYKYWFFLHKNYIIYSLAQKGKIHGSVTNLDQ